MKFKLCQAGIPTKAKRIYPKNILQKQIERCQILLDNRGMMGELSPNDAGSTIKLAHVSHIVTDLWLDDDDNFMTEIEVIESPTGKILKTLLHNKCNVSFHMIGVGGGQVDDHGMLVIGDNYKLIQIAAYTDYFDSDDGVIFKQPKYRSIDEPWIIE